MPITKYSWRTVLKLKDILKEDEVRRNFGNVAFGENPKIARLQNKDEENDTEFEEKLLQVLYNWLNGSSPVEQEELYKIHNLLKKASERFPQIFKPDTPDGTLLYRNLTVESNVAHLIKTLSKSDFTRNDIETARAGTKTFWMYDKPIRYTPSGNVQSWTSDISVGAGFSGAILLQTTQNNEYLFNQNLLDILWNELRTKPSEQEILHFGKTYSEPVYLMISEPLYQRHVKG